MLMLLLALVLWFGIGFLFARYVLGQKDFFTLIPSSLGLGMVLQVLVLNLLLYVIRDNSVLAYWLSVGILGLVGLGAWRWKRGTLEPLALGLSPRAFAGAWVVILGLWALVLPAVWNFEYFDQFWHHPLASVIAANGLPARMPLNPAFCAVYHYAPNLLGGVIFDLSNTSFTTAFDWLDTWSVFVVLGLAANFAWRISQRRSIVVGLLGMVLFFLGSHAGWVYILFRWKPIQNLTEGSAFFDHANQYAASIGEGNPVLGFSYGNFFNPYSLTLHTHSMNMAWVCLLLAFVALWDIPAAKRGSWASWLLIGLVLGVMPLAFETLWPVPMGIIVFYGLYLL